MNGHVAFQMMCSIIQIICCVVICITFRKKIEYTG